MDKIGLSEVIEALQSELAQAMKRAQGQAIQFPIGSVQLEFQVGVTRDTEAKAGVKFWVLELGASGSYANESVQKVTLNLEAPVNTEGKTVKVTRDFQQEPGHQKPEEQKEGYEPPPGKPPDIPLPPKPK